MPSRASAARVSARILCRGMSEATGLVASSDIMTFSATLIVGQRASSW